MSTSVELPVLHDEPIPPRALEEEAPRRLRRRPKRLFQRRTQDHSQSLRSAVQLIFLGLNLWIGLQFYLWVRFHESGGTGLRVSRPPGVEGWLPIASLMNLKAWLLSGELPAVHPAGVFLLVAFLAISFLFRKSFCGWLCPIGTISETLWQMGQRIFRRTWDLPRWLDIPLRSLKYILLGLFLYAVGSMSVGAIRQFLDGPYGIVADVKMLNFFRYLGLTGAIVIGVLVLLSVLVKNFWCRYLCPYGALMGLASRFSPSRIRRETSLCIDCGKCSRVCPARLPVDRVTTVRSPECFGCYQCVAACPAAGALEMSIGRRRLSPAWFAVGIAAIFLGLVVTARLTRHWDTELPDSVYRQLVPEADKYSHP